MPTNLNLLQAFPNLPFSYFLLPMHISFCRHLVLAGMPSFRVYKKMIDDAAAVAAGQAAPTYEAT